MSSDAAAHSVPARGAAAAIALTALTGLAVQFSASVSLTGGAASAAWAMLRYFTVTTNLLLAGVFAAQALQDRRASAPSLLAGMTLAILLVGVVYGLLLHGLVELSGGAKVADVLLHYVTPVLAPLFWLVFVPKGGLRRRDPWLWVIYPLLYFAYALVRGGIEGVYAYPFMNLAQLGWVRTMANAAAIMLGFVLVGHIVLLIDWRGAARPR